LRRFRISEADPQTARAEIAQKTLFRRGNWSVRIETHTRMWCTQEDFHMEADLRAQEGDTLVMNKRWERTIPRDLV
jgi:hypothetical protein